MRRGAALGWIAAAVLAGVALLALINGSLGDARRNALATEHLHRLEELQASAAESVLKLRYGLTTNYDGLNQLVAGMRESRDALGQGDAAIIGRGSEQVDARYRDYSAALDGYQLQLEEFKSRNAVLKNSLQYFSAAGAALRGRTGAAGRKAEVGDSLGALLVETLRFGTSSSDELMPLVVGGIARVRGTLDRLPPDLQRNARNVLVHAEIIARVRPEVDALTRELVFPRIADTVESLADAFDDEVVAREHRANRYRYALGLLAAALLAVAVTAVTRVARNARQLEENHRFLDRISDNIGEGVIATDKSGRIVFANREALRLIGWTRQDLLGRSLHETCHADGHGGRPATGDCPVPHALEAGRISRRDDVWFARRNGTVFPVALVDVPIHEPGELGAVTVFRDMTDTRERERDLRLAASVFDNSPYGITITDADAVILRVNRSFCEITGYSAAEVVGKNPRVLKSGAQESTFYRDMWRTLHESGQWKGELRNRRKNGDIFPEWLNIRAVRNEQGEVTHYVGIFQDLSEHKEAQRRLEYLSNYDTLTALPNRVLFQDRLQRAIAHSHRSGRLLALIFLGLDRFQVINDSLGHAAGDALLQAVARRLEVQLREADTVSRIGGDQFAVLLEGMPSVTDVAAKARELLGAFEMPFVIDGHEVFCTISIGITLCPLDAGEPGALQRNADTALFRAKDMGRNNIQFYSPDMSAGVAESMRLETRLRHALDNGELVVHYQPQVLISDPSRVVGVEALLRWHSPEHGTIEPARFIPIAEKSGLILPIGEWVLRSACAQCKAWQDAGLMPMRVAVNLSALQLRQAGLVQRIRDILAETRLEASWLEIEITESVVMEDVERSIGVLEGLRRLGCEVSIDDFGTGYSSLSYLKHFPVDTLKIDQSFIRGLGGDPGDTAVVNAIISLGESLSLKIVAEGVETAEQAAALRARAGRVVVAGQGYYFCRPQAVAGLEAFLRSQTVGLPRI